MSYWYVYVIHESPISEPYYFKIGFTNDPLKRLRQLQSGNPRALRVPDYERKPEDVFGCRVDSVDEARRLEAKVHQRLEEMKIRLISDFDYLHERSFKREWFTGLHPDRAWTTVVEEYIRLKNGV